MKKGGIMMSNGSKGTFVPKFHLSVKVTDLANARFAVQAVGHYVDVK